MRFLLPMLLLVPPAVAAPPEHRAAGDKALAARRVFEAHCAACHGGAEPRRGRVLVSDHATLVGNAGKVPFVSRLKDDPRSQVVEFLTDGSMPPGGRPRPTPDEVRAVEEWVAAGAPAFPSGFQDADVIALAVNDLDGLPEKERAKYRYVSLMHLADKPAALRAAETALAEALARDGKPVFDATLKPLAASANTVYRLNIAELGWDGGGKLLFERAEDGKATGVPFRMIPFDLIQLEYPYTHRPADAAKGAADEAVRRMNAHRKEPTKEPLAQLRAVGFVYGDWLAESLRQRGKPTPLAEELESLAKLAAALPAAGGAKAGTGPDVEWFKGGAKAKDATAPSVWAWYQSEVVPADPPFAFTAADNTGGTLGTDAAFALSATCDKGASVTCVEVHSDDYVRALKLTPKYGGDPLAPDKPTPLAENDKGTMLMPGLPPGGAVFLLVFASATDAKVPVVVRSRHQKRGVWRVLPHESDAAAGGESLPAVRRLAHVRVAE